MQTEELFNQLLNLGNNWQVTSIEHDQIDLEKIIINIQHTKSKIPHPTSNELLNINPALKYRSTPRFFLV